MRWRSDREHWSAPLIAIHWLSALALFGLFALGLWMTSLDYYHAWYYRGPDIHRSIGVLLFILTALGLAWRLVDGRPPQVAGHRPWERRAAQLVHAMLYLLLVMVMVSGYLISTADGRPIPVFGWFELPATLHGIDRQEDIAGAIHLILASLLIGLGMLHAGAALKHHFIDRDVTLRRMLGL